MINRGNQIRMKIKNSNPHNIKDHKSQIKRKTY
jgi:hypothetical protein